MELITITFDNNKQIRVSKGTTYLEISKSSIYKDTVLGVKKNNEIFFKRENDKTYKTQYSNFKKNFLKAKETDLATQLFEEKLNEFNEIQQLPKISLEDAIKSHEKEIAQFKTSDEPKSVAKEEIYGIPVVRGINQTTIWKILNKIYDNKNIEEDKNNVIELVKNLKIKYPVAFTGAYRCLKSKAKENTNELEM